MVLLEGEFKEVVGVEGYGGGEVGLVEGAGVREGQEKDLGVQLKRKFFSGVV